GGWGFESLLARTTSPGQTAPAPCCQLWCDLPGCGCVTRVGCGRCLACVGPAAALTSQLPPPEVPWLQAIHPAADAPVGPPRRRCGRAHSSTGACAGRPGCGSWA